MSTGVERIDFDTMRVNCIQIHQEVTNLHLVAEKMGISISVLQADELKTHEKTKSWDGMRTYAKELHDNAALWESLPRYCKITSKYSGEFRWDREEAKNELLDCYYKLQGK